MIDGKLLEQMWINVVDELEKSELRYSDLKINYGDLSFTINEWRLSSHLLRTLHEILPYYYEITHTEGNKFLVTMNFSSHHIGVI